MLKSTDRFDLCVVQERDEERRHRVKSVGRTCAMVFSKSSISRGFGTSAIGVPLMMSGSARQRMLNVEQR